MVELHDEDARDDATLVRAAQGGDRMAFRLLLERHYDGLYRLAWRFTGSREDAQDLTQSVCLKLSQKLRSFRFDSAFRTWLWRLCVNEAKDALKARKRRDGRSVSLEDGLQVASGDDPERDAAMAQLLRALDRLNPDVRAAVLLVHGQGLTHAEAGRILNCAEGTISWRLSEARRVLKPLKAGAFAHA